MSKILIKGGRVVSPAQKLDEACDVLIEAGKSLPLAKTSTPRVPR